MRVTLINNHYIDGDILKQGEITIIVKATDGETFSIPWTSVLHVRDGEIKSLTVKP